MESGAIFGKNSQGHLANEQPVETTSLMVPACCGRSFLSLACSLGKDFDMSDQDLLSCCLGSKVAVFLGVLSFHWRTRGRVSVHPGCEPHMTFQEVK